MKKVVYTALTGGYDALEQHEYIDQSYDYICFSNDLTISWSFLERSKFYYHGLLNPQYVNTQEILVDADEYEPIVGGVIHSGANYR